jgi:hypothetical protein
MVSLMLAPLKSSLSLPEPPATDDEVVAVATDDPVVAGAAIERQRDQAAESIAGRDDIVAAAAVQHEIFRRADVERKRRRARPVEPHAGAVRRDRERLGAVAAVDLSRIVARTTFEQVGAAARIPDHDIVAGLSEQLVVPAAAVQDVVTRSAEQQIVAAASLDQIVAGLTKQEVGSRAARDPVIAVAAEDVHGGHRSVAFVNGDRVVTALTEDVDSGGVVDGGFATNRFHVPVIDQDAAGLVATYHEAVIRAVAENGELPRNRGKHRGNRHPNDPSDLAPPLGA